MILNEKYCQTTQSVRNLDTSDDLLHRPRVNTHAKPLPTGNRIPSAEPMGTPLVAKFVMEQPGMVLSSPDCDAEDASLMPLGQSRE